MLAELRFPTKIFESVALSGKMLLVRIENIKIDAYVNKYF